MPARSPRGRAGVEACVCAAAAATLCTSPRQTRAIAPLKRLAASTKRRQIAAFFVVCYSAPERRLGRAHARTTHYVWGDHTALSRVLAAASHTVGTQSTQNMESAKLSASRTRCQASCSAPSATTTACGGMAIAPRRTAASHHRRHHWSAAAADHQTSSVRNGRGTTRTRVLMAFAGAATRLWRRGSVHVWRQERRRALCGGRNLSTHPTNLTTKKNTKKL